MPRLIDADALKEHLSGRYMSELYPNWYQLPLDVREKIGLLGSTFKQAILNAPTIDAELVRHGRWIKEQLCGCEPYYICSKCGKLHYQDYNFCNNCGAKMDGGAK